MDKHERVADEIRDTLSAYREGKSLKGEPESCEERRELAAAILRREYGEEKPGHIYAVLDFIPVEERLPDGTRNVWAIVDGKLEELYMCNNNWLTASEGEFVSTDEGKRVTHWAGIPELQKDRNVSSGEG